MLCYRTSERGFEFGLSCIGIRRLLVNKFSTAIFFALIAAILCAFQVQAQTAVSDYVDMGLGHTSAMNQLVTETLINSDSHRTTGIWGPDRKPEYPTPSQLFVKPLDIVTRPARGPVSVNGIPYPDNGADYGYRQMASVEHECFDYKFTSPISKLSFGVFVYFSSAGWTNGGGNWFDLLWIESSNNDFVTFNVRDENPIKFTIETGDCPSAKIFTMTPGSQPFVKNKWYWLTVQWDSVSHNVTMSAYDPNVPTWPLLGSNSCTNPGAADHIRFGKCDNHGSGPSGAFIDFDDMIIRNSILLDGQGKPVPFIFPPTSTSKPNAPSDLAVIQ